MSNILNYMSGYLDPLIMCMQRRLSQLSEGIEIICMEKSCRPLLLYLIFLTLFLLYNNYIEEMYPSSSNCANSTYVIGSAKKGTITKIINSYFIGGSYKAITKI